LKNFAVLNFGKSKRGKLLEQLSRNKLSCVYPITRTLICKIERQI